MLIVRTKADCLIPILFDNLQQYALPLERSDAHGLDVVRVPLFIAVEFFTKLE